MAKKIKMKDRLVFFNGKFVQEKNAKLSIYDSSLMFGDMVFEMTRSFNKKQFLLEQHIDRLFTGLKILRIDIKYSKKDLLKICEKTVEKNQDRMKKDDEHRLMIDVSRGLLGIYENIQDSKPGPNVIVADFPLRWTVQGMDVIFKNGINLVITSQRAIPSIYMDPKIKNRSRLFYLNANIEASLFKGKNNWALLLDHNGFIAEGTGNNFFLVKDGKVFTPKGVDILRGISRNYIIQLCKELKIPVYEKNIEPFDLYDADEAFVSATPFCMLPVTKLNNLKIGNGARGKFYNKILNFWSEKVECDIEKQIIDWNKNKSLKKNKSITPYKFSK
jgi:branched-chain amino acid aminotransferase